MEKVCELIIFVLFVIWIFKDFGGKEDGRK